MNRHIIARVTAAIVGSTLSTLLSGTTSAQLSLPAVPNVQGALPAVELPRVVNAELSQVAGLVDLRHLRANELLRAHRAELELDPHGEVIVRAEIVAFAPTADALRQAMTAG